MERLNEKLGDACTGGGFGRTDSRDDCNHALIQDLVQSGASISKSKALFLAASNSQPDTIKLLLRLGGPRLVNEQDHYGNTPLHVAAAMKDPQCVKVLLDHGANKELRDMKGRTPWQGVQSVKRSDASFRREFGLDQIQHVSAAAAATAAREQQKVAEVQRLLTGQTTTGHDPFAAMMPPSGNPFAAMMLPGSALSGSMASLLGGSVAPPRRGDTKLITLDMLDQGKTVAQIAAARSLQIGTIEGHVADLYQQGLYPNAPQLFGATPAALVEIRSINARLTGDDIGKLKPIKDRCSHGYGLIKLALA